jgi:hypothetical protein
MTSASITMPTLRGPIALSFRLVAGQGEATGAAGSAFAANVTVPGNTAAQLCLPRYLLLPSTGGAGSCKIVVNGESRALQKESGALSCLSDDLTGGVYEASLSC